MIDILAELSRPEVRANPFPLFQQLREAEPLYPTSAGFVLVLRHADAMAVLRATGRDVLHPELDQDPLARRFLSHRLRLASLLGQSGQVHDHIRKLVSRGFTPRSVQQTRPLIAQLCDELVGALRGRVLDGHAVDFNAEVARPLAFGCVAGIVGIPAADHKWLLDLLDRIVTAFEAADTERLTQADEPAAQFVRYALELIAERARRPQQDVLSALAAAHRDAEHPIEDIELLGTLLGVLIGGLAPMAAATCLAAKSLIERPWLRGPVAADDDAAAAFADEALRYDGIVSFTALPRVAQHDIALSGGTAAAGTDLRVALAAANRDPAVFPDPDAFEPGRDNSLALSFSGGLHRCLAPGLAREEIVGALRAIIALPGRLELAGPPQWYDSIRVRALRALPVALVAEPVAVIAA